MMLHPKQISPSAARTCLRRNYFRGDLWQVLKKGILSIVNWLGEFSTRVEGAKAFLYSS